MHIPVEKLSGNRTVNLFIGYQKYFLNILNI